jgi:hypothetical protein
MYAASHMEPDDLDTDDPELDRPSEAVADDWDLAMLRELAEMSMALARAVTENALTRLAGAADADPATDTDEALPPAYQGDPVLAQGRAARSVRLTLGLYAKIKRERAMAVAQAKDGSDKDGVIAQIEASAGKVRAMLANIAAEPVDRARVAMEQLIEAQPIEAVEKDWLRGEVSERLEDETDGKFDLPTSAIIAGLCRDLGLKPDWDRWKDEPWAVEEARASSPYTQTKWFEDGAVAFAESGP